MAFVDLPWSVREPTPDGRTYYPTSRAGRSGKGRGVTSRLRQVTWSIDTNLLDPAAIWLLTQLLTPAGIRFQGRMLDGVVGQLQIPSFYDGDAPHRWLNRIVERWRDGHSHHPPVASVRAVHASAGLTHSEWIDL